MKYPNFDEEKKLWKQGYDIVVGIDEAGRGPLAGPVVAGAVCFDKNFSIKNLKINDSKKLTEKQREEFYEILTTNKNIKWGVGIVSEKVIDKINILEATKLAMLKAVASLRDRHSGRGNLNSGLPRRLKAPRNDGWFLLLDGNFSAQGGPASGWKIPEKSIIKGDQKVFSISAASIIAKVTRDRLMQKYHKKYPQYGFDKHKGYGTAAHFASLEKFGPCKIHRKTFYPISEL